jgi:hypothetical protein
MTTEKRLLRTTYFLGLTPLLVGLFIFFTWWIGKAWFLVTIHRLEFYGFLWTLISIPIGLFGLLTGGLYVFRTFRTDLVSGLCGLICVLINIPVLLWVLDTQGDIEKRAYVRIHNRTDIEFKELTIENSGFKRHFNSLDKDDSKTRYFYPKYLNGDFDSVPLVDQVSLIIKTDNGEKNIVVPTIYKGECLEITVDKEFNIKLKRLAMVTVNAPAANNVFASSGVDA